MPFFKLLDHRDHTLAEFVATDLSEAEAVGRRDRIRFARAAEYDPHGSSRGIELRESGDDASLRESYVRLAESFRAMGMSPRGAKFAMAGRDFGTGESLIRQISLSEPARSGGAQGSASEADRLERAFRRMGMSESAANVAAAGRGN